MNRRRLKSIRGKDAEPQKADTPRHSGVLLRCEVVDFQFFSLAFEYTQDTPPKDVVGGWDWQSYVGAEEELRILVKKLGQHIKIKHAESTTDGYLYKYARANVDAKTLADVIERCAEELHLGRILGVKIADEEEDADPEKSGYDTLSDYMES